MEKLDEENQRQQHRNPMSMPPTPRDSNNPWLVFFHRKRGQNQTFYSISEGYNHVKNILCLRRKNICGCSHGWMVLSGTCFECFLLNPTTTEKIQLPPLDFQFKKCVLSSSPVDPSCIVLFISCPRDDIITFRFCSPKKEGIVDSWIKQEVKFEYAGIDDATSCDGKIYGLMGKANEILIVEVVDTATLNVRKMEQKVACLSFKRAPLTEYWLNHVANYM
ncbi:hypothetical protein LguiB_020901 [Lonicera macranthoides]